MPGLRGKGLVVVAACWAWSFPDPQGWIQVCVCVQEVFGGGGVFRRGIFFFFAFIIY